MISDVGGMDGVSGLDVELEYEGNKDGRKKRTYPILLWLFLGGSVLGFILEGIWHMISWGGWASHSATVWGPFCIIYGIAAALLYVLANFICNKNLAVQFVICAVTGSSLEYLASLFQEVCFGSTSWDYSYQPFNIGGRVSLKMTLLWGILGVMFVRFAFPFLSSLLTKLQGRGWNAFCIGSTLFMIVNLIVTSVAVLRWGERIDFEPASNMVEEIFDDVYDDDRMEEIFPNMNFGNKE